MRDEEVGCWLVAEVPWMPPVPRSEPRRPLNLDGEHLATTALQFIALALRWTILHFFCSCLKMVGLPSAFLALRHSNVDTRDDKLCGWRDQRDDWYVAH